MNDPKNATDVKRALISWEPYVPEPECGARRDRGRLTCELPPDHTETGSPFTCHMSRDRLGRWLSW